MTALFSELRERGWVIRESETLNSLPENVRARYPAILPEVENFLGRLELCHNREENAWFLTPADFQKTDDDGGFRWNEYELMGLEGAENNPELQAQVRSFWNQHLPIMMAVHSDYDYLAVRLAEPNFGSIVHGAALEWENPSTVAGSFQEFMVRFAEEAVSSEPAFPYNLFL